MADRRASDGSMIAAVIYEPGGPEVFKIGEAFNSETSERLMRFE